MYYQKRLSACFLSVLWEKTVNLCSFFRTREQDLRLSREGGEGATHLRKKI